MTPLEKINGVKIIQPSFETGRVMRPFTHAVCEFCGERVFTSNTLRTSWAESAAREHKCRDDEDWPDRIDDSELLLFGPEPEPVLSVFEKDKK